MASRTAFGFRSAKQPDNEVNKDKALRGLSRRSSITSNASDASKLPAHSTSFFSRSRKNKPEASSINPPLSNITMSRGQNLVNISATQSEASKPSEADSAQYLGAGRLTKTVQTTKSGKQRNVLRRKAPSIDQRSGYAGTESSASSYEPAPARQYFEARSAPGGYTDSEPRSILGVTAPQVPSTFTLHPPHGLGLGSEYATSSSHMASYQHRKVPQSSSTSTLPPPTPTFAQDSGSSTRRSESPGGFSRTSTPTSMSSQSPGVPTPIKAPLRTRTASPSMSRPPVTRNKFAERLLQQEENATRSTGLTAVRESATSSSSSSTVKPDSRAGSNRPANADLPSPQPITPSPRSLSTKEVESHGFPQRQSSKNAVSDQRSRIAMRLADPSSKVRSGLTSTSQSIRSRIPPPRPSRAGVPQLDAGIVSRSGQASRLQPSADIRDGKGRGSSDTERSDSENRLDSIGPARAGGLSRSLSNTTSAQPRRIPSPNPGVGRPSEDTQSNSSRTQSIPSLETKISSVRSTKDPSPQSAGSSKTSSRFGFFTKRARSPDKVDKTAKKGPAAGTGHEGYGKYARRGRSGSNTTSASRGRSTSSTSMGRSPSSRKSSLTSRDEPELDDFYRDRLAPKAITGRGQIQEDSGPDADLYLARGAQSSVSTLDSNMGANLKLQTRAPILEPSGARDVGHNLRHVNRRLPNRVDESMKGLKQPQSQAVGPEHPPTLATRRSLHRSQLFQGAQPLRIPAPINTEATAQLPIDSRDTLQSSIPPTDTTNPVTDDISEGHEGNWLKAKGSDKSRKSPRKWNFFQRTQVSPKRPAVPAIPTAPSSDDDQGIVRNLPVAVPRIPESRSVPFYALIDNSEQEITDQVSLEQFTRSNSQIDQAGNARTMRSRDPSPVRPQNRPSMLLPSPPNLASEFPKPPNLLSQSRAAADPPPVSADLIPAPDSTPSEPRKPRLQQVGRIPRVVSKRDRPHKPPPQSFSRPRPFTPHQEDVPQPAPTNAGMSIYPADERPTLGVQTDVIPQTPWGHQDSAKPASAPAGTSERPEQGLRRDEFLTFARRNGSEMSGSSSSGILNLAATTAVVPEPGTAPEEDEVWNEYNEFLDTVESPAPLVSAALNPMDKVKQQARFQPAPLHVRKDSSVTRSRSNSPNKIQASASMYPPAVAAPNRGLPSPPRKPKASDFPSTPGTISDLLASYGDRSRESNASRPRSRSTTSKYSTSSIESEADSLAGREAHGSQPTSSNAGLTAAQRLSQIYLRRDALLASRWLSFDRVLFSPAHFEIQCNPKDRVLVLDGLGNDEWSYYCAENYPGAMVYNLSPVQRTSDAPAVVIPGVPASPENHKHIHHSGLGRPFPFPQGFFTAAVFRFPAAASEAAYYNAISEFKRVLRPGGYLEMSMLDIDMVNMGNLTRKALRGIKERKQIAEPEISLKPLSDNIQKMLGKKGYENLNRCTLDVPVAGHINNSRAESFDEHSKDPPKFQQRERASNSIAKNLAKVGRWWFSSCYEAGGQQRSIWNDKALLAECEARETGFKLLLCYAQKPSSKRRTRSF